MSLNSRGEWSNIGAEYKKSWFFLVEPIISDVWVCLYSPMAVTVISNKVCHFDVDSGVLKLLAHYQYLIPCNSLAYLLLGRTWLSHVRISMGLRLVWTTPQDIVTAQQPVSVTWCTSWQLTSFNYLYTLGWGCLVCMYDVNCLYSKLYLKK